MAYITAEEMKKCLSDNKKYRNKLYCKGFVLTTYRIEILDQYPFYGNWNEQIISSGENVYYLYTHCETTKYVCNDGKRTYILIGHAYNPYSMEVDEENILEELANSAKSGEVDFWDKESELTGVFFWGCIYKEKVKFAVDCTGMQMTYCGEYEGNLYITSHSKLVGDLIGLKRTKYIDKLVENHFWHYFGTWLPGDISPYDELKRVVPNCAYLYNGGKKSFEVKRFYPMHTIEEIKNEDEYQETIHELGYIMSNTMACIAEKWKNKKVSISVTGGRDSLTALSCAKEHYNDFSYFSYISNADEAVDAKAAKIVLDNLDLKQELYEIPEKWEGYKDIDIFRKILECNAGCIGNNNVNDVKKRLYFTENPPCEIEVKSWVNEMGRGWYQNKFNKDKFPKYPYPAYWRAMHKVLISPYLIHHTNKIFKDYLKNYYSKEVFDRVSWLELYFWEFSWNAGEGMFLTSEHRVPYEITIPFNNRKYVEKMLQIPIEKRKIDAIPNELIRYMEPRISDTGIAIKDVSHTDRRALIEKIHLELFSKLVF